MNEIDTGTKDGVVMKLRIKNDSVKKEKVTKDDVTSFKSTETYRSEKNLGVESSQARSSDFDK